MKKAIIITFAVLLSVLLCSCGAVPDRITLSEILQKPYEAEIAIRDGDNVYTASVCLDESALCIEFSEPALLCGISYGFTPEQSYIVYNELNIPFDYGDAQDNFSYGVTVWKELLSAEGEYTVRCVNNGQNKQYSMTDGKTEYRFDASTNAPVFIKRGDITITFTDFKAKNDKTP